MGNSMTACGMLRRRSSHGGGRARLVFCDGHVQEFERAVKAEEVMQEVPYHWDAFIICESQDLSAFTALIGGDDDDDDYAVAAKASSKSGAGKSEDCSSSMMEPPPHLAVHDVLQIGFTYFLLPTRIFQIHNNNILAPSSGPHAAKHTLPSSGSTPQAHHTPPPSLWKPSLGTIHELLEHSLHSKDQ